MDYLIPALSCLFGLGLLISGGEFLTVGASKFAGAFGVRQITIGLTVVAFGTSAPELFVSLTAGLNHHSDLAVANVVGSNIFNIAFILGVSALIHPLKVESSSLRKEVPFLVGSSLMMWFMVKDAVIGRLDGFILVLLFVTFLTVCFLNVATAENQKKSKVPNRLIVFSQVVKIAIGLALLIVGVKYFIEGSTDLARSAGISERVIGLTIIAAGTSLPELVSSAIASFRKRDDIAVGNVIGSNIFNILLIIGICSMISPLKVSEMILTRDIPLMFVISCLLIPIMRTGFIISRIEGAFLVTAYSVYTVYLIKTV